MLSTFICDMFVVIKVYINQVFYFVALHTDRRTFCEKKHLEIMEPQKQKFLLKSQNFLFWHCTISCPTLKCFLSTGYVGCNNGERK